MHTKVLEALDDSLTDVLSSAQRKKLLAYLKVDLLESALCSFVPCSGSGSDSCCGNRKGVGVDSCIGDGSGSGNRNGGGGGGSGNRDGVGVVVDSSCGDGSGSGNRDGVGVVVGGGSSGSGSRFNC